MHAMVFGKEFFMSKKNKLLVIIAMVLAVLMIVVFVCFRPTATEGVKTAHVSIRELTELSVICALMFGIKEAMNILPNIHLAAACCDRNAVQRKPQLVHLGSYSGCVRAEFWSSGCDTLHFHKRRSGCNCVLDRRDTVRSHTRCIQFCNSSCVAAGPDNLTGSLSDHNHMGYLLRYRSRPGVHGVQEGQTDADKLDF